METCGGLGCAIHASDSRHQSIAAELARCPPPEIDGVRDPLQFVRADPRLERGQVAPLQLAREHAGREVAVGAFLRTERIQNVNSRHYSATSSPNCLLMAD